MEFWPYLLEQYLKLVLIVLQENLKSGGIPLLSSNSPQNFKQIKQNNPEILHFHFLVFL